MFSLKIFDFLVVKEAHRRASPDDPEPVVLFKTDCSVTIPLSQLLIFTLILLIPPDRWEHTSFLVTGFSNNDRCVSLLNLLNGSRSASSLRLFAASASTCKFGIEFARVDWMVETRLRARSSVLRRSESGKLPSCWMSLSVKSIASCGYGKIGQLSINSTTSFPLGRGGILLGDCLHPQHPSSQWLVFYGLM